VTPTAFVGFCTRAERKVNTDDVIFTLVMNDATHVNAWHDHLTAHGIAVEKPPTLYEAYNIYHLFVRDPDGYLLEIQTFRHMAWPRA